MKKTYVKLTLAAFVLVSVSSCKKNSSSKSKTELLTQKAWVISNLEMGSGANWVTEPDFASQDACDKDDQLIFKTDKTVEVNEGAIICDSSTPEAEYGTWSFTDNETKITLGAEAGIIDRLDESTMIIRSAQPDNSGSYHRTTFTH